MRNGFLLFALVTGLLLASCGGSGSEFDFTGGPVALYITDDPGDQFPGVEIILYSVNLCPVPLCIVPVNLYDNPAGRSIDLAQLSGILEFISVAEIPEGHYNRLEVTLDRVATITDDTATIHPAYFDPENQNLTKPNIVLCPPETPGRCIIRFSGTVQPFSMGRLVIDFVLKDFEVEGTPCPGVADSSSWCITEVKMKPLTPGEVEDDEDEKDFKIKGTISEIFSDSLTFVTSLGIYSVTLNDQTECEVEEDEAMGITACLAQLEVGMCVKVETSDDPALATTLLAHEIEAEDPEDCEGA